MKINTEKHIILFCEILILMIIGMLIKTAPILNGLQKDTIIQQKKLIEAEVVQKKLLSAIAEKNISPVVKPQRKLMVAVAEIKVVPVIVAPTYFIKIINGQITAESLLSICKIVGPKYSIDPELLYAMCERESNRFVYCANINCKGLMQIYTYYHRDRMKQLGVTDIYDPYGNILLAADFMNELKKEKNNVYYNLMRYNMPIKTANNLFAKGQISSYALGIVSRSNQLKGEGK